MLTRTTFTFTGGDITHALADIKKRLTHVYEFLNYITQSYIESDMQ